MKFKENLSFPSDKPVLSLGHTSCFPSQLAALFSTVLNSTKQSPSQLDSSTLVSLGYVLCGAKTTEMNLFNAVEFR